MNPTNSWFSKFFSAEHRKSKRYAAPGLAAYYWEGTAPMAHRVKDISSNGLYLMTQERWHPGTLVTMTLQKNAVAPPSRELYIAVQTKVVRLGEDGVGFTFVQLEHHGVDRRESSISSSRPAGKRAIETFLSQLMMDLGLRSVGATDEIPSRHAPLLEGNPMSKLRDDNGQALVIGVLSMTCLLGFAALAADVGVLLHVKRVGQTAADSAAIAAATQMAYGNATAAGRAAASQNGVTNGANGATVTVNGPPGGPAFGPHAGNSGYVEAIVSQTQPTIFMRLFNQNSMTVATRAVATYGQTKACIYTLNPTGTDIQIIGNATIQVTTCGIVDDSNSPASGSNSALYLQGHASLNAQSVGVVGGYATQGNVSLTPPNPTTGIVPVSDPLAYLPVPSVPNNCVAVPHGATTLSAGCYNGISIGNHQTMTLNPGMYIINGDLTLGAGATLSGTAVTLVLEGLTNMGGHSSLNITAPTSGTYNGVAIYQPATNTNSITLIGTPGATFQGIIYAPTAAVTIQGNSGANVSADFVVGSLTLIGNASLTDYAYLNSGSVLKTVRLVE